VFWLELLGGREAPGRQGQARIARRRDGGGDSSKTATIHVRRGGAGMEAVADRAARPGDGGGGGFPAQTGEPPGFGGEASFPEGALALDTEPRVFAANAANFEPLEGRLPDPLGGFNDVRRGFAASCPAMAFSCNPARLLRAMSIAA
jgi:tRNA nucleotidyltransferase/poly(A) polymerase